MKIKIVLLVWCLVSVLNANNVSSSTGVFEFNKESEQKITQNPELRDDGNIIYVSNISGVGESLEKAKKDAIQNAMKFGVGEYLVSK
ncbi:hypothetical protein [Campylobacter blaseri]|uniref:hypothetical protein n=1 Tax=Campylobacter blaseri TaxID=2042961 RepID=UPI001F4DA205|nr:hypothetical protein [Campylobacter blaseri]